MNSMELVRFPTGRVRPAPGPTRKSPPPFCSELIGPVRNAIVRARHLLVTRQRNDGSWRGRQTGDVSLASQLVFLLTFLEQDDSELAHQCASTILREQRPDGGWSLASAEASDVSTSVQAYFALKLTGQDPTDEPMAPARERIRQLGGVDASDKWARLFLALLGQLSYDHCEPTLLENSQLHAAMSVVWSHRPVRKLPIERGVRELFINKPGDWPPASASCCEVNGTESRLLENMQAGRISELSFSDLIWHIIALRAVGYQADSAEISICEETLNNLVDVDEEIGCAYPRFRTGTQPDSALAIRSLIESGISPNHPAIKEGLDHVCNSATATSSLTADSVSNLFESLRRAGQSDFERESALPPDIDIRWDWQYKIDAAAQDDEFESESSDAATELCIEQLLTNQNQDGGWSDIADPIQKLRSSEPAATGAALESLPESVDEKLQTSLSRGNDFLRSCQLGDGSWATTNGTLQLLSTSAAIRGLLATGAAPDDDCIAAGANWLIVHQSLNGSWKENPMETAWAILGLLAAGKSDHPAVRRGIKFLLDSQDDDGGWLDRPSETPAAEPNHTFRNDLHSICWPLLALSRFAVAASSAQPATAQGPALRLIATAAEF